MTGSVFIWEEEANFVMEILQLLLPLAPVFWDEYI
jgi:hypothetical protein